ncbi:tannase/feruloyl esterase family alpha/beta hydrolase [Bradyrhizobium sp. Ghvi]|uniref:tannase/feruloyl esterase family alpha/beta hydrolase n=1 Tax=Bradyrhizobium sp. Ghvi TaxID=1855319 RepID=UPI0015A5CCC4|nr:tannase/feruloyl esterase family alpha/beta hydrolase [Bradyrhizobium sp. Ghvi]
MLLTGGPSVAGEAFQEGCIGFADRTIPATLIGLPSGNAVVASVSFVPAAAQAKTPDFCKVLGTIAPVDPKAQLINFELNLPAAWNGKLLQYGGGGYNGSLITGLAPLRDAAPDDMLPLARGYATVGTDSGHQTSSFPRDSIGKFALNDEMLTNYAYASYKKVRDVAVVLSEVLYRRRPVRIYYFGGSEGGREGLTMAQHFPLDYDGVVSVAPVVQLSMLFQSYIPNVLPQFDGGWLNPVKTEMLAKFVMEACDELDGLRDGIVSNTFACQPKVNLAALRCPDGTDTGDNCLSDPQIASIQAVHSPHSFPFAMTNGITTYPQWLYGNETTPDPDRSTMARWVVGTAPPKEPLDVATASQQWIYGVNAMRFVIARHDKFDVRSYRPEDFRARVEEVSKLLDSTNPDLSGFFAHGGKLIMRENLADLAQSPLAGINYFRSVVAKLGQTTVDASARLYLSPGSTHTGNGASVPDGAAIPTMVDLLDPLDRWASDGIAPADALIQAVKEATPPFALKASRPMCRYPNYPHYVGGDKYLAHSYDCRKSAP